MKLRAIGSLMAAFILLAGTAPAAMAEGAAENSVSAAESKPKPKTKKPAKRKKKGYDYKKSKYKSDALSGSEPGTYKFNLKDGPAASPSKGKSARKKGKSEPAEGGSEEAKAADKEQAGDEAAGTAGGKAGAKKPAAAAGEEYLCTMGDYRGPITADGRCPKCGMALQKAP